MICLLALNELYPFKNSILGYPIAFHIDYNYLMEEFYRRKYLSPTYSRASSYLETLEKDKTVAELRKELQDCKEMEEKFDDLCLEIVKLERENKKIESEQSQIEGEYMEKIKRNKGKITELKQAILDCREDIQHRNKNIATMEADNDKLLQELQRTKRQAEENLKEKAQLGKQISLQNDLISELKSKIEECKIISIESNKENQLKSEELNKKYQQLKKNHLKLKEEQLQCEEKKVQLDRSATEKDDWLKKVEISKQKMLILQGEWLNQNKENAKLESQVKEMSEERSKMSEASAITEKELQRTLMKSKEGCSKIKANQIILMQSIKRLQKDQINLQKAILQDAELKQGNEKLEEKLQSLADILEEEQESYTRIIGHMKQSIVQDQKAIESLSKQASMLEHLIV